MTNPRYEKVSPTKRYLIEDVPNKYYPGQTYERRTVEIKHCGRWLRCDKFTNTCGCGADFNWSGDLLAPREQWGEETGEHPADIARIR